MTETRGLAVVVGGTKGLGRALSLQFGQNGFEVLATYSTDHLAATELEDVFRARGIPGSCLNHDATGPVPLPAHPHSNLVLIYNVSSDFVPAPFHLINGLGRPSLNTLFYVMNASLNLALIAVFAATGLTLARFAWAFAGASIVTSVAYQAAVEVLVWRREPRLSEAPA